MAQMTFVLGLYRGITRSTSSAIGLGLWTVGLFISAMLPLEQRDASPKLVGMIAQLNGPLHILSLDVGAFLFSRSFKQDEQWRSLHRTALTLSLIMILLFIATTATLATNAGIAGVTQKVFVATAIIWFTQAAMHLRRLMSGRSLSE